MSEIRATTISDTTGTGPATLTGQYAAKAWVNFDGTGTVAIRQSGNVSSITDNGTGNYAVNLSSALTDANAALSGGAYENATGTYTGALRCVGCSLASSSVIGVFVTYQNGGPSDNPFTSISATR